MSNLKDWRGVSPDYKFRHGERVLVACSIDRRPMCSPNTVVTTGGSVISRDRVVAVFNEPFAVGDSVKLKSPRHGITNVEILHVNRGRAFCLLTGPHDSWHHEVFTLDELQHISE